MMCMLALSYSSLTHGLCLKIFIIKNEKLGNYNTAFKPVFLSGPSYSLSVDNILSSMKQRVSSNGDFLRWGDNINYFLSSF